MSGNPTLIKMTDISPENVTEDNDLTPKEKETNIRFDKTTNNATIFTSEGGIMRRLLQHPEAEIINVKEKGEDIVGMKAIVPIAIISISSSPRKQTAHSTMVTNGVTVKDENAKISI